jgi:uncharacterized membrane protein YvlD (DUF360 family)
MAIALSKEKVQAMHGLNMIYTFITMMVVNTLMLAIANSLAPNQVVLGTYSISYWWAIYHSMFKLSVIATLFMPLITYYEWKNKTTFTPKQWMMTYFVVNVVALWSITRYAENLGFGVSSWVVVVVLAFVFNFVQGMAMLGVGKYLPKA